MGGSGVGDDFGNADLALGLVRGVEQHGGGAQAGVRGVVAHFSKNFGGVRGGVDAGNFEFRKGFDVIDDCFELRLEGGDFIVGEFEAGEVGDVADVDVALRHGMERQEVAGIFQVPSAVGGKELGEGLGSEQAIEGFAGGLGLFRKFCAEESLFKATESLVVVGKGGERALVGGDRVIRLVLC